jgi:hypothetical protein
VTALPTSVLVGRDESERDRQLGFREEIARKTVEALLERKGISSAGGGN